MKKIYLKPTTKVVVLNNRQHLLAGSPGISTSNYSGGEILAPGRNNYDDFDDFDE